jgi:hypothetical protein
MRKFIKIFFFSILLLAVFFYGIGVGLYKWNPYNLIKSLKNLILYKEIPFVKEIDLNIEIKPKSSSALLSIKEELLRHILPDKEIPIFIEKLKDRIYYSLKYYGTNHKSVLYYGKETRKKCLKIYIEGHGGDPHLFTYHNELKKKYLEYGCDFLSMSMLGLGLNKSSSEIPTFFGQLKLNNSQSSDHRNYSFFYDKNNTKLDPLTLFLYPHIRVISEIIKNKKYDNITVMGISGGGWYTVWLAALMPEIKTSISYAGSLPLAYRKFPGNFGDWEQVHSELYRKADYFDLYRLMLIDKNGLNTRKSFLIYNSDDDCCFMNPYASHFKNLIKNNKNFPQVIIDENNAHEIRPEVIYKILDY